MNIERLRNILSYNEKHSQDMKDTLKVFCQKLGIDSFDDVRNILQIIRHVLSNQNLLAIQLPLKDKEIGGFIYRGDTFSYLVCNSALPVVTSNFAFCHELYHAFFPIKGETCTMQVDYFNTEEESMANYFAANILMPETVFIKMFNKFKKEDDILTTVVSLMSYFNAPFMAVFIRCYELKLYTESSINPEYLNIEQKVIEKKFEELWFNSEILKPSNIDDSSKLKILISERGNEYIEKQYINKRTLDVIMKNLDTLLSQVKAGE